MKANAFGNKQKSGLTRSLHGLPIAENIFFQSTHITPLLNGDGAFLYWSKTLFKLFTQRFGLFKQLAMPTMPPPFLKRG